MDVAVSVSGVAEAVVITGVGGEVSGCIVVEEKMELKMERRLAGIKLVDCRTCSRFVSIIIKTERSIKTTDVIVSP